MTTIINNKTNPQHPEKKKSSPTFNSSRDDFLSPLAGLYNTPLSFSNGSTNSHFETFIKEDIKNLALHMQACEPCNKIKHKAVLYMESIHSLITPRVVTFGSLVAIIAIVAALVI